MLTQYAPWRRLFYKSPDGAGGGDGGNGTGGGSSGTSSQADGSGSGNAGGGTSNDDDANRNNSELERARKDAANYRTKLRDTETRLKDLENAGKTDTEKLQGTVKELSDKLADYEAKERAARTRQAVSDIAADFKPKNPERVAKLLMADGVEVDEDGDPKNPKAVKKALETLRSEMPELFQSGGTQAQDAGARGGAKPGSMNEFLRGVMRR